MKKPLTFRSFQSINPFTNELIKEYDFATNEQIQQIIQNSRIGFLQQKSLSIEEKSNKLQKLGEVFQNNQDKIAKLITEEVGKPLNQSQLEVQRCITHCKHYAENLQNYLAPKLYGENDKVILQPLGLIYNIVPFNYPFWIAFKFAVPNLALGNVMMIRNSDSTPRCGELVEELAKEAGYDKFEIQNVFSKQEQLKMILKSPTVKGVQITGSTRAGKNVAQMAGRFLKKSVMELGGSDPVIIQRDADIDAAIKIAIQSRFQNCGQVCFSGKRFFVDQNIFLLFQKKLINELEKMTIGDPMENPELGPLARKDLVDHIEKQLEIGVSQGAEILYGGQRLTHGQYAKGNFFQPTVVKVSSRNNILFKEETFGPVLVLFESKSNTSAIKLANFSKYGLGSVIITKNTKKAQEQALKIESGAVFINRPVTSFSHVPIGGIKNSGYGRGCGEQGLQEFANIKLIHEAQ